MAKKSVAEDDLSSGRAIKHKRSQHRGRARLGAELVGRAGGIGRPGIYATRDPDFFAFYRSMQAYERSMQHGDTRLVLRPDSDFFRYFGDPSGKPSPPGSVEAATAPKSSDLQVPAAPKPSASK